MKLLSAYELADLQQAMMERMEFGLLEAITTANRNGDLPELLKLLHMDDLVDDDENVGPRPTKVAVLGGSTISEGQIVSLARSHGIDRSCLDCALEYDLKHYDFSKFRNTYTYRAVLVGPMPHSTPGKRDSSSFIAEMKSRPDIYPPVIEMRDRAGELKITRKSFVNALNEIPPE